MTRGTNEMKARYFRGFLMGRWEECKTTHSRDCLCVVCNILTYTCALFALLKKQMVYDSFE